MSSVSLQQPHIIMDDMKLLETNTQSIQNDLNMFRKCKRLRLICCKCGFRSSTYFRSIWCMDCMKEYKQSKNSNLKKRLTYLLNIVRSKIKNKDCLTITDLHNQWYKQEGRCALTGIQMTFTLRSKDTFQHITNVCITRCDKTQQYSPENILLVCVAANITKYKLSIEQFRELCLLVTEYKAPCKFKTITDAYH